MTDYREILRLHSLGHSIHGIALGVPCARNTASRTVRRAKAAGLEMNAGTVLCSLYQLLTPLYITPTLIPVSLDACRIDTPSFSALRSTASRLPLSIL